MSIGLNVGFVLVIMTVLSNKVQDIIPYPLIDEIFHIPAVQRYCVGNFTYMDPKITTPPGPYLLSFALIKFAGLFTEVKCDIKEIRLSNALLLSIYFSVIEIFAKILHGSGKASKTARTAVTFPLVTTFSLLFYTDVTSLLFVMIFSAALFHNRLFLAMLTGVASLMFRQTNIVWLFFTSCISFLYSSSNTGKAIRAVDQEILAIEINPFRRYFFDELQAVGIHLLYRVMLDLTSLKFIIITMFPFLISLGSFISFLLINNGIVLGDKEAHTAVFNPAQLLYFSLFTCAMAFPSFLFNLREFLTSLWRYKIQLLVIIIFSMGTILKFPVVHPYNLADNRHFVFYAWRLMWKYRLILTPAYAISLFGVVFLLPKSFLWQLVFWISVAVTVVPQKLFEFRYFMVPYTFILLFSPKMSHLPQQIWHLLITIGWLCIFQSKEIYWESEEEVQRIIW